MQAWDRQKYLEAGDTTREPKTRLKIQLVCQQEVVCRVAVTGESLPSCNFFLLAQVGIRGKGKVIGVRRCCGFPPKKIGGEIGA